MKTETLYKRAINNGCEFEAACFDINIQTWDKLMEHATRANRVLAVKIAEIAGVIDEEQARTEIRKPYFNPYSHFKTNTHLIYVHSSIEHFIRIN